jgi:hypothetical protein
MTIKSNKPLRPKCIRKTLNGLARAIDDKLAEDYGRMGFVFIVFELEAPVFNDGVSNVDRESMLQAIREFIAQVLENGRTIPPVKGGPLPDLIGAIDEKLTEEQGQKGFLLIAFELGAPIFNYAVSNAADITALKALREFTSWVMEDGGTMRPPVGGMQ